jgi:O-methyltransferase
LPTRAEIISGPIDIAKRYSKAGHARLKAMVTALEDIDRKNIEGDVVECGVWRGGHIMLARMISPQRICWLYDTFDGMTVPGPFDKKRSGLKPPRDKAFKKQWTKASLVEVMDNFKENNLYDDSKLKFIMGDVSQTLLDQANIPTKIALLRLDTDWYESTKIELEILFPRLVRGGILIVDDYGHWMGARKAVKDYLGERVKQLVIIDYTGVMLTLS